MRQILITVLLILLAMELPLFIWILFQFRKLKAGVQQTLPDIFEKFANMPSIPGKADADREMLTYLALSEENPNIPMSLRSTASGLLAQRKLLTGLNILVLVLCALLTLELYVFGG